MANTNTPTASSAFQEALKGVSDKFRDRLIKAYTELKRNSIESRYEAAGLSAGKFCEVGLRLLQQRVTGNFTPFATKINNFADECRNVVAATVNAATDSEKTILPRALVFLYTMRNKRGIGHVGGDVDANSIDVMLMSRVADWVVCELIRIHHGLSLEEAQALVDALAVRQIPDIWEVAGKRRVLREGLTSKEESLLLLYSSKESAVLIEDLIEWVEYSNPGVYKVKILRPLHKSRLVEWDAESDTVILSPKGAAFVEDQLL